MVVRTVVNEIGSWELERRGAFVRGDLQDVAVKGRMTAVSLGKVDSRC